MDRSLIPAIRLSDVPPDLNTLIETWLARFGRSQAHVQLYLFERENSSPGGGRCEQRVAVYSDNQQYMIHARWGDNGPSYLGCIARARKPRAGEDQNRGSDLADGPFTYGTWLAILGDIVSYEMVVLAKTARPVPDGHAFPAQDSVLGQGAAG